jgi:cytochrome c oxidase subunit II
VVIVAGGIFWCAFRYRARPGDGPDGTRRRAPQFQYHIPIEAAYTIIPLVIVAVLFGFMYNVENKEDAVSKTPAVRITVQGYQWGWRFLYPNGAQVVGNVSELSSIDDTKDLPVLYMPEHETVQLKLESLDVNHSFYVPEFLFKRDLIQGVDNVVDFNIDKPGFWIGECTQLCGTYHAYMRFHVDVMPVVDFNQWMSDHAGTVTNATGALPKAVGSDS